MTRVRILEQVLLSAGAQDHVAVIEDVLIDAIERLSESEQTNDVQDALVEAERYRDEMSVWEAEPPETGLDTRGAVVRDEDLEFDVVGSPLVPAVIEFTVP